MTSQPPGSRRFVVAAVSVVIALLLTLLLTACSDDEETPEPSGGGGVIDGGEPADPVSDAPRPDATVSIDLSVADDRLLVAYSVTNDGDDDLLVATRLPEEAGADTSYAGDIAYVTGKGDRKVQLSHRVFPQPDTDRIDVAEAPRVGSTLVAPGEALNGGVEVDLPVERRQPFGDDLGYGTISLPDPVSELEFCLGVIPAPFPRSVAPTPDEEDPDLLLLAHGDAAHAAQYLFCSDPLAID